MKVIPVSKNLRLSCTPDGWGVENWGVDEFDTSFGWERLKAPLSPFEVIDSEYLLQPDDREALRVVWEYTFSSFPFKSAAAAFQAALKPLETRKAYLLKWWEKVLAHEFKAILLTGKWYVDASWGKSIAIIPDEDTYKRVKELIGYLNGLYELRIPIAAGHVTFVHTGMDWSIFIDPEEEESVASALDVDIQAWVLARTRLEINTLSQEKRSIEEKLEALRALIKETE